MIWRKKIIKKTIAQDQTVKILINSAKTLPKRLTLDLTIQGLKQNHANSINIGNANMEINAHLSMTTKKLKKRKN